MDRNQHEERLETSLRLRAIVIPAHQTAPSPHGGTEARNLALVGTATSNQEQESRLQWVKSRKTLEDSLKQSKSTFYKPLTAIPGSPSFPVAPHLFASFREDLREISCRLLPEAIFTAFATARRQE
jgi:hypothetical protein